MSAWAPFLIRDKKNNVGTCLKRLPMKTVERGGADDSAEQGELSYAATRGGLDWRSRPSCLCHSGAGSIGRVLA